MSPIPSGRLKNPKDVDKWSSLSLCLQLGECELLVSWTVPVQSDGLNSALSPVVYGDIFALSIKINTQYTQLHVEKVHVSVHVYVSL